MIYYWFVELQHHDPHISVLSADSPHDFVVSLNVGIRGPDKPYFGVFYAVIATTTT